MNIPNVRIESGLELRVRLKDNGVSLDWSSLQGVKALLYSVEQKAVAGAAEVAIDNENPQILIVKYPGSSPQYTGLAKLIVRCEYNGKQKTYDTAVANFVETTDEATGVIVLDDPTISVGISVEDVSTSLLDEAINAAFSAAQQAKDEADKLPGIATNLQNAIDAAEATNSEIKSNESERLKSEQKRENSESTRVAAEQARASAEEARKTAENSRINKENLRISAESQRESNESEREARENQRIAAEEQRKENESGRDMQEAQRQQQEQTRQQQEQTRQQQEQTRQQQEQTRQQEFQTAEQSRQATFAASESARDTEFQSKESQRDAAMQTISQEAQKLTELQSKIDLKQDTISDLETIREGAALGKTALQKHQDISGLATKEEVAGKQNIIDDLDSIRSGAAKGATALQSETDPIYTADKPSIALKNEIPDVSGKADKTLIVTETEGSASYSIVPNKLTKLGTLASAVTFSLNSASEEAGVANIYDFIFTTPADAPSITWPEGISWVGGSAPAIAGGKTYEVSIMDNLATYGEF